MQFSASPPPKKKKKGPGGGKKKKKVPEVKNFGKKFNVEGQAILT